jgi:DNA-binding IclR family transcriptional regulator
MSTVDEVLAEVQEVGPVTVADIVRGIGAPETNVRRALARLESDGLVSSSDYQLRAKVYIASEVTP